LWHGGSFVEHVVHEVRRLRPDFGRLTISLSRGRRPANGDSAELRSWSQHVGATFSEELSHLEEPLVIVLDDYNQLGGDQSFFDFIVGAMSTLPPHVRLVLAGRTPPQLPLAQWILEDRAALFEAADLKFNIAETEALAAVKNVAINPARARDLCEACEGWAAGLSLSLSAGAQLISTPDGSRPALVAYLLNQISATLPDTLIEFLERTSVLESLNATFLSKFGGIPDAPDRIREIESSGALLTVVARERVYRVHPLLREALINRIRSRDGEEAVRELHRWAGMAFEEAAEPSAALFNFEQGGDFKGMVRVLRTRGTDLLDAGQADRVSEIIGRLRVRGINEPALFGYLMGTIMVLRGDSSAGNHFAAGLAAAETGSDDRLLFALRCAVIDNAQDRGDPVPEERLAELLAHGVRLGGEGEADALLLLGWAEAARFDFQHAAEMAERALAVAGSEASVARRSRIVNLMAYAQTCLGDFGAADAALASILRELEGSDDAVATCQLLILYARTALLWGDVTAVHDYASLGASLAHKLNLTSVLSMAYLYLGYARTHMGDAEGSKAAADSVRAYNPFTAYSSEKSRIDVSARQYVARALFLSGDSEAALATLRRMLDATDLADFQRPILLTDAAIYAHAVEDPDAAALLELACTSIVQAVPNHGGEAARLADAATSASILRAARNLPPLAEFDRLPAYATFGRLVRARFDFERGRRVSDAMRGLFAASPAAARAAVSEFYATLTDLCSSGPRFSAIVALAASARIAHDRPSVAGAMRAGPPKCYDVFPADLPALAGFSALVRPKTADSNEPDGKGGTLTKREREILVLLAQGLTNKEIAQRLVLSVRTVDAHVEHVLAKLNVSSRTRAVAAAVRSGLLAN
jgi:ATP/maltotriose-dependent transcriptional regulator MalT